MDNLKNIAAWQQKADEREIAFYRPSDVADRVFSGETPLVLGRKGSGKTALLNFIVKTRQADANFMRVKFNPTLLRDWHISGGDVMETEEYYLRWQVFIYHSICRQAVRDGVVAGSLKNRLSIRYDVKSHASLGKWFRKLLGSISKVAIGSSGIEIERGFEPGLMPRVNDSTDWAQYLEICRDDVLEIAKATGKPCVAVFDEIDLTFDPHSNHLRYRDYVNCIKGLLACGSSMILNPAEAKSVFSIIALRSDIFEAIDGPEFNAWNGKKVFLEPDMDTIRDVLAYRISKSIGLEDGQLLSFSSAWRKMFASDDDFEFMFLRSLNRLRDYVEFIRMSAQVEIDTKKKRKRIQQTSTFKAYHEFKSFLLREFIDEIYFKYEFGSQLIDAFRLLYQNDDQHFTYDTFKACCERMGIDMPDNELRELIKDLFRTSVVGFRKSAEQHAQSKFQYRFEHVNLSLPTEFWEPGVQLGLHRAVRSALDSG